MEKKFGESRETTRTHKQKNIFRPQCLRRHGPEISLGCINVCCTACALGVYPVFETICRACRVEWYRYTITRSRRELQRNTNDNYEEFFYRRALFVHQR